MVKDIHCRMIRNLQSCGGSQDLQYIHEFFMDLEFASMDNILTRIMGDTSQMINLYKGDHATPTLTAAILGPYKGEFMQAMTQDINELEQHGTCTIVSRKSVTGAHILIST